MYINKDDGCERNFNLTLSRAMAPTMKLFFKLRYLANTVSSDPVKREALRNPMVPVNSTSKHKLLATTILNVHFSVQLPSQNSQAVALQALHGQSAKIMYHMLYCSSA